MGMKRKWKKQDGAVSEVIGAILMVGIGVALFSVLYFIVMSYPFTPPVPSVDIVGSIQGNSIVLEHRGGDSLDQNATVSFIVGGTRTSNTVGFFLNDTNGNDRWDIGEQLVYRYNLSGNMTGLQVEATVVDRDSNSIMMIGVLQEGIVRGGSPPMFGAPSPTNGSTGNLLSFAWSIPINDPDGDVFSWTIHCSNGQTSSGIGASNGTKSLSLSGLVYLTVYKVWVNATDPGGSGLYTRRWFTFTTKSQPWSNRAPTFSSPSPVNGSTSVSRFHATNVTVSDLDGNSTTVCFWNNKTGSWLKLQQNNSVPANSTVRDLNSTYANSYSTKYWWKVTAFDGHVNSSVIYSFTTKTNTVIINLKPNLAYDNTSGSEHTLTAVELASLNFSDNNRYSSFGSWGNTFAKRIEFNFPDISSGATVLNVTLYFEWARSGTQVDGARLGIWDGSTWIYSTLTLGTAGTDVVVTKYLSGIINTAAKVNSLKFVFQATSSPAKKTTHDWVQVDVTYT
jgi:FlaG/FlaF family flagellin (archaellin)